MKQYKITDALMFASVMSNKEICKQFIERILPGKKIKSLEIHSDLKAYVETEKTLIITPNLKQIRLDVLFIGEEEWINIEMQMGYDISQPLRARYYDATMTVSQIKPGEKYEQLKANYVIFINPYDIYGKGDAIYIFYNMSEKYGRDLSYDDKTYKIVVCTENFNEADSPELKSLLNYLNSGYIDGDDSFVCELDGFVQELNKPDSAWRANIMTIEELMENRYSEGREEGREQGKKETALKMLKRNYSFEEISELTELSIEEIEKLQLEK